MLILKVSISDEIKRLCLGAALSVLQFTTMLEEYCGVRGTETWVV